MPDEIEFVNDWSELELGITELAGLLSLDYIDLHKGYEEDDEIYAALHNVVTYVPRLLTQYANLVELSFALTEGWETYATLNAPTGLYLPDNS